MRPAGGSGGPGDRSGSAAATRIEVDTGGWSYKPETGASVSVNGCCLTVVSAGGGVLGFDAIPQTLAVTSLGRLKVGDRVNLEHAATPTTLLGGHIVLGHVDGLAEVVDLKTAGEWRVRLLLGDPLGDWAVDKGSIALDGVSLTIARVEDSARGTIVDVCLIPETLERTNLGERVVGDRLNVEADYLAKLVARQVERAAIRRQNASQHDPRSPRTGA
jgi:riboflavin synthase